jgi:hypothetical protein
MEKTGRWLALIAAFCLFFNSWSPVQAQTPESEYFPQTGHNVRGEFLQYYRNAKNPTVVFGYPITEQFTNREGKTVQYFQRARFELDPVLGVRLTPLGRETYSPGRQLLFNNPLACRSFPATGFSVCYAFLEFFDQNGGVALFGNPISPFEYRNNQIVQYFENARFEWRPERAEGQRVAITDLGRIYFEQSGEDPAFRKSSLQGFAAPNLVLQLQVRAFPNKAVTKSSDSQTIYVIVQDQNLQPVVGARGDAVIRLANGSPVRQNIVFSDTGVGKLEFPFQNQPNGKLVNVDITIFYNGLRGRTTTSFRIWY